MTELNEELSGVGGGFKSYVEKLIPVRYFTSLKKLNVWDMMLYSHMNN